MVKPNHTMQHFDTLKIYSCERHCEKRRYCSKEEISAFLTMFSAHMALIFNFKCTLEFRQQFVWIWTSLKFCCLVMGEIAFNPFPNKPWFLRVCRTSLFKTLWEKEKLLVTSNFSFSHSVFYLFYEFSASLYQIWNCRLQTLPIWNSLKFVVWEKFKREKK